VELVRGNQVHPYHLLRYDRVVFSRPAIEKLQDGLKKSVGRRAHAAPPPAPRKRARVRREVAK
jgi:large subunit ribosomal protein L4